MSAIDTYNHTRSKLEHLKIGRTKNMNTAELSGKIADDHNISKTDARAIVDNVFASIVSKINEGEEVSINGVGKFSLKATSERQGRNPSTGEAITIKAQRKMTFAPAKAVKDQLNS